MQSLNTKNVHKQGLLFKFYISGLYVNLSGKVTLYLTDERVYTVIFKRQVMTPTQATVRGPGLIFLLPILEKASPINS
jgi:hypothetical protein